MRGAIMHAERAKQLNDFNGLQYGNITPTDIDGVIDYKDRAMVFLEIKFFEHHYLLGRGWHWNG